MTTTEIKCRVIGGGTVAYDEEKGTISPHIHVSMGSKDLHDLGHTSHLMNATILYIAEIVFVEVLEPKFRRLKQKEIYDLPLLDFV